MRRGSVSPRLCRQSQWRKQGRGIDNHFDRRGLRVGWTKIECAVDVLEVPSYIGHHHVPHAKLGSRVARLESPSRHIPAPVPSCHIASRKPEVLFSNDPLAGFPAPERRTLKGVTSGSFCPSGRLSLNPPRPRGQRPPQVDRRPALRHCPPPEYCRTLV